MAGGMEVCRQTSAREGNKSSTTGSTGSKQEVNWLEILRPENLPSSDTLPPTRPHLILTRHPPNSAIPYRTNIQTHESMEATPIQTSLANW